MALTPPGWKVWEYVTPATVALSPIVSGWFDTTGYTNLLLSYVFTNSTGSTTPTIEGSFDGSTLDTDMTYAALAASPQLTTGLVVAVLTPFIRFRIVQATADATRTRMCVQARA
jgi:hypothetical protein